MPQQNGNRTGGEGQPTKKIVPVFDKYPKTILLNDKSDEVAEGAAEYENQSYSQADFKKVWNGYATEIKDKRPRLSAIMKEQIPELSGDNLIVRFIANSHVQRDWLYKNVHDELEGYLRKKLHNSEIKLEFEVEGEVAASSDGTPYTSQEKFNYLLEKSEALRYMREVFGLKTD